MADSLKIILNKEIAEYAEKKKNDVTGYGARLAADVSVAKALQRTIMEKSGEFKEQAATLDKVQQQNGLPPFCAAIIPSFLPRKII